MVLTGIGRTVVSKLCLFVSYVDFRENCTIVAEFFNLLPLSHFEVLSMLNSTPIIDGKSNFVSTSQQDLF